MVGGLELTTATAMVTRARNLGIVERWRMQRGGTNKYYSKYTISFALDLWEKL